MLLQLRRAGQRLGDCRLVIFAQASKCSLDLLTQCVDLADLPFQSRAFGELLCRTETASRYFQMTLEIGPAAARVEQDRPQFIEMSWFAFGGGQHSVAVVRLRSLLAGFGQMFGGFDRRHGFQLRY